MDIFDSYFNGRNMYKTLYYQEASEQDIVKFMKRVQKYAYRINYNHFEQFSKRLEFLSIQEYAAIKRSNGVSIKNITI